MQVATKYADRAFISINGARIADIQSASLKQNQSAKEVPSMTDNGRNRGFVQGNKVIDITFALAVQNQLSRPKLEAIDYEANDVQMTWVCGGEIFVCTGLFNKDVEDNAGGVGEEVKGTFNFGALDVRDAVGNSVLFPLSLG
jgi:hypothetical protein